MSYNYLPLDRKRLNFQQVTNLLDYNQLVSITFDAHERILRCREYVDSRSVAGSGGEQVQQQYSIIRDSAVCTGEEVPEAVVKLMLMLKIKSLSQGNSGIDIETVKRLMDMYNNGVLPVIYKQATDGALSHLCLLLTGTGSVYSKGAKTTVAEVFSELNWAPVNLQNQEALALTTGTQFTSAYGMWSLKKAVQLLKMADIIAALSYAAVNCSRAPLHEKLFASTGGGAAETAAVISRYLPPVGGESEPASFPFSITPRVHGAAKDAFHYVLEVFLNEINAVTETHLFFPKEDLVLNSGRPIGPLVTAQNFLSAAISDLADVSEKRLYEIIKRSASQPQYQTLSYTATGILNEIRQGLVTAPFSDTNSNWEDHFAKSEHAGANCINVINNTQKVLAIELLATLMHMKQRSSGNISSFLGQFVNDFSEKVVIAEHGILHDEIESAVKFIEKWRDV